MKYDYSNKSWDVDTGNLKGRPKDQKKILRYVVIAIAIIIIALLIWAFSGSSNKTKAESPHQAVSSAKAVKSEQIAQVQQQASEYQTIALKIPATTTHSNS